MTYRKSDEIRAHDQAIRSVDALGERIATGGGDSLVHLFSADGAFKGTDKSPEDVVNSVRFALDGRVASGSKDRRVRVWDPGSDELREIGRHENWVMGVAWSPDGERLATVSEDATFRVWDAAGHRELARVDLGKPANAVDWSPRGDVVAVAGGGKKLVLFTPEGKEVRVFEEATQMIWSVRFSPSGDHVAWAGRDRMLRLAAVPDGEVVEAGRHGQQVWSVAWSPDGDRVATASADRTVRIWSGAGDALELVESPDWARFGGWVGDRLLMADERGRLLLFEDDGTAARKPDPAPEPPSFGACPHIDPQVERTETDRCEECGSTESLRLCLTCGHVGCCESQLAHGTRHWEETGHPNTTPTPPGKLAWRWCYECDTYVKKTA